MDIKFEPEKKKPETVTLNRPKEGQPCTGFVIHESQVNDGITRKSLVDRYKLTDRYQTEDEGQAFKEAINTGYILVIGER